MPHYTDTYRRDALLSMTPGRLILELYGGLMRRLGEAAEAYDSRDSIAGDRAVERVLELVVTLQGSLEPHHDPGLVRTLDQLYATVAQWLLEASATASSTPLAHCRRVLVPLHEGWKGAVEAAA